MACSIPRIEPCNRLGFRVYGNFVFVAFLRVSRCRFDLKDFTRDRRIHELEAFPFRLELLRRWCETNLTQPDRPVFHFVSNHLCSIEPYADGLNHIVAADGKLLGFGVSFDVGRRFRAAEQELVPFLAQIVEAELYRTLFKPLAYRAHSVIGIELLAFAGNGDIRIDGFRKHHAVRIRRNAVCFHLFCGNDIGKTNFHV